MLKEALFTMFSALLFFSVAPAVSAHGGDEFRKEVEIRVENDEDFEDEDVDDEDFRREFRVRIEGDVDNDAMFNADLADFLRAHGFMLR